MCIICVDVQKGKLKLNEAWRNLGEMRSTLPEEHIEEVEDLLWAKWIEEQVEEEDWYTTHGQGD